MVFVIKMIAFERPQYYYWVNLDSIYQFSLNHKSSQIAIKYKYLKFYQKMKQREIMITGTCSKKEQYNIIMYIF